MNATHVEVYHNPNFFDYLPMEDGKIDTKTLRFVAIVNLRDRVYKGTEALDFAFQMTNSIESAWVDNKHVFINPKDMKKNGGGYRSTSTGDVMVYKGSTYIVDFCGFKEIDWNE